MSYTNTIHIEFWTKAAEALDDDRKIEQYQLEGSNLTIICTTTEREDFERSEEQCLNADVIEAPQFRDLFTYLQNGGNYSGVALSMEVK
jgi:hypothetical protein